MTGNPFRVSRFSFLVLSLKLLGSYLICDNEKRETRNEKRGPLAQAVFLDTLKSRSIGWPLMPAEKRKRLYIVDGMSQLYRAYYAIRGLSTSTGIPTNAIYGFAMMLRRLINEEKP
jgi:hypothetical protein